MKVKSSFLSGAFALLLLIPSITKGQQAETKLIFEQGREYNILVQSSTKVTQEAMGQAIDYSVETGFQHRFTVTNTGSGNTTLHHKIDRVRLEIDGMGQNRSIDSNTPEHLKGEIGAPIKEILEKEYDMVIDQNGIVLMARPEVFEFSADAQGPVMLSSILRDRQDIINPPKKGEASIFKILPDKAVSLNEGWVESTEAGEEKSNTVYTLSSITDSTYVIDFKGSSNTILKAEAMGMETVSNLTNDYTGYIIVDRNTGIMKEKETSMDSHGTIEVMGGTMPITSKKTIRVIVN